jgi:arsenate reductase
MSLQNIRIEKASPSCLQDVLEVLTQSELPHDGVREYFQDFFVARGDDGAVIGCVGLERHGEHALLRSLAVLPAWRGRQIGNRLVEALLDHAKSEGIRVVALLTTTAKEYFAGKFGFESADRAGYESKLQNSPEWNLPRCSSAVFMTRRLAADKKRVLILCTGNSARSQMAEGLLRHDRGEEFEVHSAGVKPGFVRPEAIEAMREIGIDISSHRSKSVAEYLGQNFDYVITVCDNANETCPAFPGKTRRIHRSFEDPPPPGVGSDAERLAIFRRVRDEIRAWLKDFA